MRRATVTGFLFGWLALVFAYLGVADWTAGKNCESYKKTDGKVVRNEYSLDWLKGGGSARSASPGTPYFHHKLVYSYAVDGKEYTSDRISYPSPPSMTQKQVDAYNVQHPDGSLVTVYYDAKNPSQATLENTVDTRLLVLPICVFIFAGFISLICFLVGVSDPAGS